MRLPWRTDFNALVYVLSGSGTVGAEGRPIATGQLAVYGPGERITIAGAVHQESRHPSQDVIVPGGAPIREPVAWGRPFVLNTREEVLQAVEDYQAGRLGVIPATPSPMPASAEQPGRFDRAWRDVGLPRPSCRLPSRSSPPKDREPARLSRRA